MGRKSKNLSDYKRLAEDNDLEFAQEQSPRYTTETALWRCKRCGRISSKSYHSIARVDGRACYCRTGKSLSKNDYIEAASSLSIKWRGDLMPQNVYQKTKWLSVDGKPFEASYSELFYGHIPERYTQYVSR